MTQWAAANLTPAELLASCSASASDPAAQAVLARTPADPARDRCCSRTRPGFSYVQTVQSTGGWAAVNAYFTKMPESTEQILHPEKYAAGEAPIAVTLPADLATQLGAGWTVPLQDTFGEFQLGHLAARRRASPTADATTRPPAGAATAWRSSRARTARGRSRCTTAWDTTADAPSSRPPPRPRSPRPGGPAQVLPGAGGTTRWVADRGDAHDVDVANAPGLAG